MYFVKLKKESELVLPSWSDVGWVKGRRQRLVKESPNAHKRVGEDIFGAFVCNGNAWRHYRQKEVYEESEMKRDGLGWCFYVGRKVHMLQVI